MKKLVGTILVACSLALLPAAARAGDCVGTDGVCTDTVWDNYGLGARLAAAHPWLATRFPNAIGVQVPRDGEGDLLVQRGGGAWWWVDYQTHAAWRVDGADTAL